MPPGPAAGAFSSSSSRVSRSRHTTAAHTIVFLYTAPIFTALGLRVLPEEHLSRLQWAGIGVAFLGIAVAFLGFDGRSAVELLVGDALALLAGVSWGFSNVVLRRGRIGGASTAKTVFYQVATVAILLGVSCSGDRTDRIWPRP